MISIVIKYSHCKEILYFNNLNSNSSSNNQILYKYFRFIKFYEIRFFSIKELKEKQVNLETFNSINLKQKKITRDRKRYQNFHRAITRKKKDNHWIVKFNDA